VTCSPQLKAAGFSGAAGVGAHQLRRLAAMEVAPLASAVVMRGGDARW
jgi:hypothetical protein